MILTSRTTPEELAAAADECIARTRAAQGLPPHIEDDAALDRLAMLIDVDPPVATAKRGAA
jgi:hypothetical protein